MSTVWKYTIPLARSFILRMPVGARPLSVQVQRQEFVLWALVEPDANQVDRVFSFVGTGHEFDVAGKSFIGTVQADGFVWHLFEVQG